MNEAQVIVRQASPADAAALAALRWEWSRGVAPAEVDSEWGMFRDHLGQWMFANEATHFALIAEHGGDAIGMAWLALLPRVPVPGSFTRMGADLQSVYVSPQWRGRGIGIRLVEAVIALGSDKAKHMTVRSGRSATSFYPQLGFAINETSLERALP